MLIEVPQSATQDLRKKEAHMERAEGKSLRFKVALVSQLAIGI